MTRAGARVAATAAVAVSLAAAAAPAVHRAARARTAGVITVTGPIGDPLADATPSFAIRTAGFLPAEQPLSLTLQVSARPDFSPPLLVDTTVAGDSATIVPRRALPDRIIVYWRARAVTATAESLFTDIGGPRTSATWLTLLSPNAPNGTTVDTRRPVFVWRSAGVSAPPGPWSYDLLISGGQQPVTIRQLTDTSYIPAFDLETNTSYRWAVTARLATGDSTRSASLATFVIVNLNQPLVTLLYQNFPNPFPTPSSGTTCVWFDLQVTSHVRLDIFDLRGNHVRTLFPRSPATGDLPAGRYGRGVGGLSGCDPTFAWDGTAEGGRVVPGGVYLIRLRTPLAESFKKIVFLGR
jgi:hypothetical protein